MRRENDIAAMSSSDDAKMSGSRMMEGKRANESSTQQAKTAYRRATSCFRGVSITLSSQKTALSITDVELLSDAKRRQAAAAAAVAAAAEGPSHHQQNENKKAVEMELGRNSGCFGSH